MQKAKSKKAETTSQVADSKNKTVPPKEAGNYNRQVNPLLALIDPTFPTFKLGPIKYEPGPNSNPQKRVQFLEKWLTRLTIASKYDASVTGDLDELKQQIKHWRGIYQWTESEAEAFYLDFETVNHVRLPSVVARIAKDPSAGHILHRLFNSTLHCIHDLIQEGNKDAAALLWKLASEATELLNILADANPEVFKDVSRRSRFMPVMKSSHPFLSTKHGELLQKLQLAADYPLQIDPLSKWNPNDKTTEIALQLFDYVSHIREWAIRWRDSGEPGTVDLIPALPRKAAELAPLTKDTMKAWWVIASQALLQGYPEPEQEPRLDAVVTAASHRTNHKKIRGRILLNLRARFYNFVKGGYKKAVA